MSSSEPVSRGAAERAREHTLSVEDWTGVALMVAIMAVMALGVFFRYVLNDSLSWSEEVARYGLVAITFIGCGAAIRRRSHVRIDLLDLVLPPRALFALRLLLDVLVLGFLAYAAWRTWQITGFLRSSRSPAMQMPINVVYWCIFAGFVLAALRQIQIVARDLRAGPAR
jgi:TRAP-type C4-dicarboxylate transport system permease small subunit